MSLLFYKTSSPTHINDSQISPFVNRGKLLTTRLLSRAYQITKLPSTLARFYGRHHDLVDPYTTWLLPESILIFATDTPGAEIFLFLFTLFAAGGLQCGGRKTSPRTSTIEQFIFYVWPFEISVNILRNQK